MYFEYIGQKIMNITNIPIVPLNVTKISKTSFNKPKNNNINVKIKVKAMYVAKHAIAI
jgi:hypothetical protein